MAQRKKTHFTPASSKHLDEILHSLYRAFIWSTSDEGHDYWSDVGKRLIRLREEALREESDNNVDDVIYTTTRLTKKPSKNKKKKK